MLPSFWCAHGLGWLAVVLPVLLCPRWIVLLTASSACVIVIDGVLALRYLCLRRRPDNARQVELTEGRERVSDDTRQVELTGSREPPSQPVVEVRAGNRRAESAVAVSERVRETYSTRMAHGLIALAWERPSRICTPTMPYE